MKQYFAKYLPVEGEIKMGDKFFEEGLGIGTRRNKEGLYDFQKVKLFLCSRDIQVGDEVQLYKSGFELGDKVKITSESNLEIAKMGMGFKVIGEISSEATWVKEGDEFDETELGVCPKEGFLVIHEFTKKTTSGKDWTVHKPALEKGIFHIVIKGPCGYYH